MALKKMLFGSLALCAPFALAARGPSVYGDAAVQGAWAFAEDPGQVRVVVTNKTVWTREAGTWMPTFGLSPCNGGIEYHPQCPEARRTWSVLGWLDPWQVKSLAGQGLSVTTNDVVLAEMERSERRFEVRNGHRLVSVAMPDFSKSFNSAAYVGFWKPVKVTRNRGQGEVLSGEAVQHGNRVRIRDDMKVVIWQTKHERTSYNPEPGIVRQLVPTENWLRVDYREDYASYSDPLNCRLEAFWLDPEGHLRHILRDEVVEFVRTDETFEDPLDARARMVAERKFQGTWGVNREFKIYMLSFDANGKGVLSAFMFAMPFDWKVRADGLLVCILDPVLLGTMGGVKSELPSPFLCRYDAEKNTMTTLELKDSNTGKPHVLPFLSQDVHVREIVEQMETLKKSPRFKREKDVRAAF